MALPTQLFLPDTFLTLIVDGAVSCRSYDRFVKFDNVFSTLIIEWHLVQIAFNPKQDQISVPRIPLLGCQTKI